MIVWGADRNQALARMSQALAEFQLVGLASNIAFLKRLVSHHITHAIIEVSSHGLMQSRLAGIRPQIAVMAKQEEMALADVTLARANKKADWNAEVMFSQRGPAYSNMAKRAHSLEKVKRVDFPSETEDLRPKT